ncbi:FliM/FliN family flagellar motor switch protein [Halovulum marinum]
MQDDTDNHPGQTPIAGSLPPTPVDAPDRRDGRRESALMGVPIEVMISVGKARPLVSDLVKLRRDSVVTLNSRIDDPVEMYIGERLIARGELQEMDDGSGRLGVRLTEVADLSKGV